MSNAPRRSVRAIKRECPQHTSDIQPPHATFGTKKKHSRATNVTHGHGAVPHAPPLSRLFRKDLVIGAPSLPFASSSCQAPAPARVLGIQLGISAQFEFPSPPTPSDTVR